MIVLDASVLIAHLDSSDARHARAAAAMDGAAGHRLGCSSLTLAAVLVGPARHGRLDAARCAVVALGVHAIPFGDAAATRLARLRVDTGLKLPACCVLLAAQDSGAATVVTLDDALTRAAQRLELVTAAA